MDQSTSRESLHREVQRLQAKVAELESANAVLHEEKHQNSLAFEELVSIFDGIDEPIYVADPNTYDILYVNQAAKNLWGEGVDRKCHAYLQGRDTPCPFCTNEKIFGEHLGRTYIWEFRNEISGHWFRCLDKAIHWPDGRLVRYEMAIDVSNRKQIEQSLEQTRQQLEAVIEAAGLGTLDWDLTTGKMTPNAEGAKLLGYDFEEYIALSQSWENFIHEDDLPAVKAAIDAHFRGETPNLRLQYRALTKQGQWRWRLVCGKVAERAPDGKPLRALATVIDVDDRKQIEKTLHQVKQRLELVIEGAQLATIDWDFVTNEMVPNTRLGEMLGYSNNEMYSLAQTWWDLIHEEDLPSVERALDRHIRGDLPRFEVEYRSQTASGQWRWLLACGKVVQRDKQGTPLRGAGIIMDIHDRKQGEEAIRRAHDELEDRVNQRTVELAEANEALTQEIVERKQAEQALRDSEETARALLNGATDAAVLIELDGTIVTLNEMAAQRLGGTINELIGRNSIEYTSPEVVVSRTAHVQEAIRSGRPVRFQDEHDGRHTDNNVHPVFDSEGNVFRLSIYSRDVTKEIMANNQLRKEQQLLHQLLNLQERERQLVAYEIHDGLAQELTGASFRFQGFRELLSKDPEEAWDTFAMGLKLLDQGIKEARSLITGLRPPILDELGIVAAIEYLVCESHQRGGPHIEFQHDLQIDRLVSSLQTAIFRIVQESLTNARRHSQSDRVCVEVVERDAYIHITVQDWGVGFDPASVNKNRFGLEGLRERVRLLGGRMSIDTELGHGTKLFVDLPIVEPSSELVDDRIGQ